ncbi:hypothetical protein [Streptomyces sp. NRRL F-2580]|uniref:hypothetical protein n=1 Tax=Streptomyces sp. NRRL F-2580 TaxID=1463841 RepID=UPI00131E7363|nr:hypothetical protein [Streptomyces sp. NRRL F-2580]
MTTTLAALGLLGPLADLHFIPLARIDAGVPEIAPSALRMRESRYNKLRAKKIT